MVRNYVRRELDSHPDAQLNSQELVYKQVMSIPVKQLIYCLAYKMATQVFMPISSVEAI